MLVLIGESCSGKTSIQKELEKYGIPKIVTCTTRIMRKGEINGKDYRFLEEEEFTDMQKNGDFIEHAVYRGWEYGTARRDVLSEDGLPVLGSIALTPAGLRAVKREGIPHLSFYINVDRRTRLISCLKRGDDIEEAYRRNLSDVGMFDGIVEETDHTILNTEYSKSSREIVNRIILPVYQEWRESFRKERS